MDEDGNSLLRRRFFFGSPPQHAGVRFRGFSNLTGVRFGGFSISTEVRFWGEKNPTDVREKIRPPKAAENFWPFLVQIKISVGKLIF